MMKWEGKMDEMVESSAASEDSKGTGSIRFSQTVKN